MNTRLLSLVFLFFGFYNSFSQEIQEIVPPSPTAASLAQFADVPVSSYTGLPNIGVPIYTIKSGPLSVPIDLRYHGGGIKVGQEASWVGLGWSLSTGGSISRVVRGNDDLFAEVEGTNTKRQFIYSVDMPDQNASEQDWDNYYNNFYRYGHDPEPDIFYYNFGTFSGKFVIQIPESYTQNEIIGNPLDAEAVKIIYFKDKELWEITDPMGVKYEFSVPETTKTYSFSSGTLSLSNILANKNVLRTSTGYSPAPIITTWYLKEITSPVTDHAITFEYEENQHETQGQIRISQSAAEIYDLQMTCPSGVASGISHTQEPRINSGSIDVSQDVYLSKINYTNGYVQFNTSDRIDLLSKSATYNPQRLDSINVYNTTEANPSTIVTASFEYDYFQKSVAPEKIPEYYRLKLSDVKIQDQNYEFTYNDPGELIPSKVSLSIDHWGYYNNANNHNLKRWAENIANTTSRPGTLIPGIDFSYTDYNGEAHETYYPGANREPNEDFTKYFILEEIKLPTGGTKTFEWEQNQYRGDKVLNNFESGNLYGCENLNPNLSSIYETVYCESEEFEITDNNVWLNLDVVAISKYNTLAQSSSFTNNLNNFSGILKWDNGQWVQTRRYLDLQNFYNSGFSAIDSGFNLEAGLYKMFINYQPDLIEIEASWDYYETVVMPDVSISGAGLRIEKTSINDGYKSIIRKFNYLNEDQTKSSGISMANIGYHYTNRVGFLSGSSACTANTSYLFGTSNSIFSLSVRGNNHVGYSRVSSSYEGSENLGETISEYYNYEPYTTALIIPLNFPMESDPRNGKPKSVTIINGTGINLEKKTYLYSVSNSYEKNTPGIIIHRPLVGYTMGAGMFPSGTSFTQYPNYSKWSYLSSESSTRYDKDGNNPITTAKSYAYDNADHLQLTKTTYINSKEETVVISNAYPSDYPTGTSMTTATFNQMIEDNILNPVIKQETTLNGSLIATQVNTYKIWDLDNDSVADDPDDAILPEYVKIAKGTNNAPENRIEYHSYYENGNLKEVSKADGTTIVYIWGYNDEYPIAKIENAAFSDLPTALYDQIVGHSNNENDRTIDIVNSSGVVTSYVGIEGGMRTRLNSLRSIFPNAMVTTYTYDPLIGVTSVTDPKGYTMYYEYDDFNRLKQVKDASGKILSQNEYHYKGQQ